MSNSTFSSMADPTGRPCPLVKRPLRDCYCVNLTSDKIRNAVTFCGENYQSCAIYRANRDEEPPARLRASMGQSAGPITRREENAQFHL